MHRWRGRVALVTGASAGMGAAIARQLVRCGMKVMGCSKDVENIQKLAAECQSAGHPGVLASFKCDLTIEEDIQKMFSAIKAQHKGVDVCINNAGLAHPEALLSGKTSGWKDMLDLNVLALSVCTREAYQSMKERNVDDGHIININRRVVCHCFKQRSGELVVCFIFNLGIVPHAPKIPYGSMCGHRVAPNSDMHFYTASKYAVTALTEGLRQELREAKTHIRATSISPGLVETDFTPQLYRHNPDKATALYNNFKPLEAIDIVSAVLYILSAPPHVQIGDVQMRPVEQPL